MRALRQFRHLVLFATTMAATTAAADGMLLAVCQPRTARGEAAGLQVETYFPDDDWRRGDVLPLPGVGLIRPMQLLLGQRFGIAIVQGGAHESITRREPWSETVLFGTDPLRRWPVPRDPGWEPVEILCAPETGGDEQRIAVLDRRMDGAGGRLRLVNLSATADGPRWRSIGEWGLAGDVAACAGDWLRNRIFVVAASPRSGSATLTRINVESTEAKNSDVTFASGASLQLHLRPVAVSATTQGDAVCVLGSGYSLTRGDGAAVSLLEWFDPESLESVAPAREIPGRGAALWPGADQIWATTFDETTGFAYAAAVAVKDGQMAVRSDESFRAASRAPYLARDFERRSFAVAGGRTVRLTGRSTSRLERTFDQSIESTSWSASALYAGIGARIVKMDSESAQVTSTGPVAGGFVIDLIPTAIASHFATPAGSRLPARIELQLNSSGRDLRILRVTLNRDERLRIDVDIRTGSWLRATTAAPVDGEARVTLRADSRAVLARGGEVFGAITVVVEANNATTRTALIDVAASAGTPGVRAIEWQLDKPLVAEYPALRALLAGAPLHLSQRDRRGPFSRPPRDDLAAIVRLEEVQRGAITRQVLLDYVAGGGGLLVIAGHAAEPVGEGLRRWLEPLGVLIDPGRELNGRFSVVANPVLDLGLDQLAISAGAYMETTRPLDLVVPAKTPGTAALALTRYGYGRLAVIASDTPFEDRALAQAPGRRFARALFGWLAGVNTGAIDCDLDGLRDDVEDVNGNRVADRAETDWLNEDTDRDGVPDGREDINLNGIVDEGESNPRLADSDGDGAPDGSDPEPLPRAGTPVLLAAQPSTAPGEGGTPIELVGRNLPGNPQVWFGEQRATHVIRVDSTRLIAMPAPRLHRMDAGPMAVRVAEPLYGTETALEGAFTYTDTSEVRMSLEILEQARRAYDGYRGRFAISFDLGEIEIESAAFFLQIEPRVVSATAEITSASGLAGADRAVRFRSYGGGQYRVELGAGESLSGHVELATVNWRIAEMPAPVESFKWYVYVPDLRVPWGGGLRVSSNEIHEDLRAAPEDLSRAGAPEPR